MSSELFPGQGVENEEMSKGSVRGRPRGYFLSIKQQLILSKIKYICKHTIHVVRKVCPEYPNGSSITLSRLTILYSLSQNQKV